MRANKNSQVHCRQVRIGDVKHTRVIHLGYITGQFAPHTHGPGVLLRLNGCIRYMGCVGIDVPDEREVRPVLRLGSSPRDTEID